MNRTLDELIVYNPKNTKRRFGSTVPSGDGGYVVVDGYTYDYYVGCGVGGNASFDIEFLKTQPNINGLVFDGSISHYPRFSNHVYFVHKNIGNTNTIHLTNLNNETKHFENIFMKMDIEGHEWNWIKSFENLNKVKQLVIEIHGVFLDDGWNWGEKCEYVYEDVCAGLQKINQTHHLVHFHSNSSGGYTMVDGKELPTVAELTFIRKVDCEINGYNKISLPIVGLDFRNGYNQHDLSFTEYPFVHSVGES